MTMLDESQVHDLYQESLEVTFESDGNVEAPTGWFAIIPENLLHGWVILAEDNQGFKFAVEYDTEVDARGVFNMLSKAYAKWEAGNGW